MSPEELAYIEQDGEDAAGKPLGWIEALGPTPTITDVLSTFLALLELARRGRLNLVQPAPYAPMVIRRESPAPAD